jgi:hypothetical protein
MQHAGSLKVMSVDVKSPVVNKERIQNEPQTVEIILPNRTKR